MLLSIDCAGPRRLSRAPHASLIAQPLVVAATRPAPRATDRSRDEFEEGYFYTAKSANRGVLYASSSPSELMEKYRIS